MAQDIGQDIATAGTSVTLLGSNLGDTSTGALTGAADFGDPTALRCAYEVKLDCQVSADDFAYLWIAWSADGGTDYSDSNNYELVATIDCVASTVVVKVGDFPVRARYGKFALENQSGGTINSASTALALWDNFVNVV